MSHPEQIALQLSARPTTSPPPAVRSASGAADAFLSYARKDVTVAKLLQRRLQSFAKPWYRLRRLNVFRDESHLTGLDLSGSISAALDRARFLVVLASPAAAESDWVAREIARWFKGDATRGVSIVLAAGEIAWSEGAGDFDWQRTTALPRVLSGRFAAEPRWLDLRSSGGPQSPEFLAKLENAAADLGCTIIGLPKEELVGEDVRQHRRLVLLRNLAITLLAVLTLAASVAALLAYQKNAESERRLKSGFALGVNALQAVEDLRQVPGASPVRAKLTGSIQKLLQELSPDLAKSDGRLLSNQARSKVFEAEDHLQRAELAPAQQLLREAEQIYLRPEHQQERWAVYGLSDVYDRLARSASMAGDSKGMGEALANSVRYAERAHRIAPDDGTLGGLEVAYDNLGIYYQQTGDLEQAAEKHNRALKIALSLFEKDPSIGRRDDLVRSYVMLSELSRKRDRPADELDLLRKAQGTLPRADDPQAPQLGTISIEIALRLAQHAASGVSEREAACARGRDEATSLMQAEPEALAAQVLGARMLAACAALKLHTGELAGAGALRREALGLVQGVLAKEPTYGEAKEMLDMLRAPP